jgi:Zn-dependent protease with chaperone function
VAPPAAATPTAGPGSFLRAGDHRIVSIVYRLGLAGRAHCPETFPLSGLAFHHLAEYGPEDRAEVIALNHVDRGIGILSVVEGSAAARALLQAGDVIMSVNGAAVPTPAAIASYQDEKERRRLMVAAEEVLESALRAGPARIEVLRGGVHARTVTLGSDPGCPARGRLARSGRNNAFADGRYVIMTTGFLDFFRSDEELAVALAHELAHNVLRHPQQLMAQGVPYNMMRHIGRNARLVRATEVEADLLSVRLLAAAGYDLDAIMPFWRRLHGRADSALNLISAHPGLRSRQRYISAAIAEVRAAAPAATAR